MCAFKLEPMALVVTSSLSHYASYIQIIIISLIGPHGVKMGRISSLKYPLFYKQAILSIMHIFWASRCSQCFEAKSVEKSGSQGFYLHTLQNPNTQIKLLHVYCNPSVLSEHILAYYFNPQHILHLNIVNNLNTSFLKQATTSEMELNLSSILYLNLNNLRT